VTPRTVVIRGTGTNALSFTIPSNVDFNVESVVASVDAAAAGDTIGELSIAEVTGEVIATKRQGLPIPAGDTGTETWALRLDDETAGGGTTPALQWATGVGEDSAVVSGVDTMVSFDAATLLTNSPTLYTIDAGVGYTGLGIHAAGTYLTQYSAIFERVSGAQPANPQNIVAEADEGGNETTLGPFFGSNYGRGFVNVSAHDQWDVSWSKHIQIVSDTGAAPLVITVNQPSGANLDCIVSFYVVRLPT
jgi:hypothetical protein